MTQSLKTALRLVAAAGIALCATTCTDAPVSVPFDIGDPQFDISDGATGGNEDVFFLPPLVSNPAGRPEFGDRPLNPDLEGAVFARICETDGTNCIDNPPPWIDDLPMTLNGDHYQVVWNAKGLRADVDYRINIFIGDLKVAHRDVDLGKGGSCKTGDDLCTVKNNVPIKVRIESFAACIALDPNFDPDTDPCATATLDPGDNLLLQEDGEKIGAATLESGTATISLTTCTDFRDRASIDDGRVDLPTFGDCVVIDALELSTFAQGTATVCNAFEAGQAAGLSDEQIARATVHRFSTDAGFEGVFALPHADFEDVCDAAAPLQGRVTQEFSGAERFARLLRKTWWTIADHVHTWAKPSPLWASPPVPCHRGGCTGSSPFRSDFEAALSAGIDHHPDPIGSSGPYLRDLGDYLIGDVIEDVSVRAWDSGECDGVIGCVVESDPVDDVRLTVKVVAGTALIREGSSTGAFSDSIQVVTGTDGIAEFDLEVGAGLSNIEVSGIGVAIGKGNVQAPALSGSNEVGPLNAPILPFAVEGFQYTIEQAGLGQVGVEPLVGIESVEDFYDYDNTDVGRGASSHTVPKLEISNTSILFLYEDNVGQVSLVMIHDDVNDGSGGAAIFEFANVPSGASFIVRDGEQAGEGALPVSTWNWLNCCTDGGALGILSGSYSIEITADFPPRTVDNVGQIEEWVFLTGDISDPDQEPLEISEVITIRAAGSP